MTFVRFAIMLCVALAASTGGLGQAGPAAAPDAIVGPKISLENVDLSGTPFSSVQVGPCTLHSCLSMLKGSAMSDLTFRVYARAWDLKGGRIAEVTVPVQRECLTCDLFCKE